MRQRKVLSFAAASGRACYVFFDDGRLMDWELSKVASETPERASAFAKKTIDLLSPDTVVTEKITKRSRKGTLSKTLIAAIANEAASHAVYDIAVVRQQHYPDKYIEAEALAKRFPDIQSKVSKKPAIWESEPRNTILFEAIALALPIIDQEQTSPELSR